MTLKDGQFIRIDPTGGRLVIPGSTFTAGIGLNAHAQLRGVGALSIGNGLDPTNGGALIVNDENPMFQGVLNIDGGRVAANFGRALGSAAVQINNRGGLQLNALGAAEGDIMVKDGTLLYAAPNAVSGVHTITANGATTDSLHFNGSIEIGATSVGSNRFYVAANNFLHITTATPGLLNNGSNLTLEPSAIV